MTLVRMPFSSMICWTMCPGGTCIGIGSGGPLLDTIRTVAGPKTAQTLHVNIAMLHRRHRPRHPNTRDRTQPTLSSNCGSIAATTSLSGARYGKNMTSTKPLNIQRSKRHWTGTEPRLQAICSENLVKLECVASEICTATETDRGCWVVSHSHVQITSP